MESWQKTLIHNNLVELIRNTICNAELITRLRKILGESDEESLSILRPFEKSKQLYKILSTRVGAFNVLIKALEETNQTGALKLLQGHNPNYQYYGLIVFDKDHILGRGCAGTIVYKGEFDRRDVAVKVLNSAMIDLGKALKEVELLKKLEKHENIIGYYFAEVDHHFMYIALELLEIDLQDEMKMKVVNLEPIVLLRKITVGVSFLHSKNILHRDLKPANILLNRPDQVKITDFGMSKEIPNGATSITVSGAVGTADWMAPEILAALYEEDDDEVQHIEMTSSSDIFSLGCIFYFVLSNGTHPFGRPGPKRQNRILKNKPQFEVPISNDKWMNLIRQMISKSPKERPSSSHILEQLTEYQELSRSVKFDHSRNKEYEGMQTKTEALSLETKDYQVDKLIKVQSKEETEKTIETWQKEKLRDNFVALIRNTICSAELITRLVAAQILEKRDEQSLSILPRFEKSKLLYKILETRTGSFIALLNALEETKQTEALKILKEPTPNYQNFGPISFDKEHVLGRGYFGTIVYKGKYDDKDVAVKILNSEIIEPSKLLEELKTLKNLHNENIVKYYFAEINDNFIYLALELCQISLQDEIKIKLFDISPLEILKKCVNGLSYLHGMKIVHKNLRPTNILITNLGQVKLSDYGLSNNLQDNGTSTYFAGVGRATDWMPPEELTPLMDEDTYLQEIKRTTAGDIFSLGCIFYFVLSQGSHPFGKPGDRKHNIVHYIPHVDTFLLEEKWKQMIREMISQNPSQRPPISMILSTYFNNDETLNLGMKQPRLAEGFETTQGRDLNYQQHGRISFNKKHVLGKGYAGTIVFKGKYDGKDVAVKVLYSNQIDLQKAFNEVEILKKLDKQENVIQYLFAELEDNFIYIAMELMDIDLQEEIRKKVVNLDPILILKKCTAGLSFLHSKNILHLDLKPTNILLSRPDVVKITDFGISKEIPNGARSVTVSHAIGTADWMAPEILRCFTNEEYDVKQPVNMTSENDIFSLGCVFYYVLSNGIHPFGKPFLRQYNIMNDKPQLSVVIDDKWMSLIREMISFFPKDRPSSLYILEKLAEFGDLSSQF